DERGDRREELLTVVEDQQRLADRERGRDGVQQRDSALLVDAQRGRQRAQRRLLARGGREVDKQHLPLLLEPTAELEREPRLARPARSGQRDQADIVAPQQR